MITRKVTRRTFHRAAAAATLGFTYVPQTAFGANDRLRIACIGIGGKGYGEVVDSARAGAQIVALCDVDDGRRMRKGQKDPTELFPQAAYYRDFRRLLEKEDKRIDAVTVSTPDHTHFPASMMAMRMGKHVYCQKPLSHSIWEARQMAEAARRHQVATQMGNQAHAGEPIRRAVEWIRAGLIGKVSEVHAWTNRPIWPQGMQQRPAKQPIPDTLNWDLWLGPAPFREYHSSYVPFKWRGWWDFGTGALGDMGCHIMDMPYWALQLKHPSTVVAESEGNTRESAPRNAIVRYEFPAGPYSNSLKFVWYDGGKMPPRNVIEDAKLSTKQVASKFDLVMIGEKGKLFFKRNSLDWIVTPSAIRDEFQPPAPSIPRVANEDAEWQAACRGGPPAQSNFDYAGPLSEFVLLGNLAIRVGKPLEWDGAKIRAKNTPEAEALVRRPYRDGWS